MKIYILLIYIIFIYTKTPEPNLDKEKENTIFLNSDVNEIFASTQLTQYFINPLNSPIELSIKFPIKEEINLSKFVISIGEKVIISKIMPKKEAEQNYEEALEKGNFAFISKYDEEETNYIVNIGNINPKEIVKLNTFFIQMIGSQDMSYEFVIMEKYPTFHYKELNENSPRNKKVKAKITIEAQSKITRLVSPFLDEEAKKNSKYEVSFSNDFKKSEISYIKNPDDQKNIDDMPDGPQTGFSGLVNKPTFLTSFCILFRTENMNKPILFYQYNHEL